MQHLAFKHKEGKFQCDLCDFVAAFPGMLEKHKEKHGTFPCDKCSFTATLKTELTKHVKYLHSNRLYPCDLCDYVATKEKCFDINYYFCLRAQDS